MQALIFDVQRFSIHDGPGVRTTVFFKGCPLRCRWCQNPESLRPHPELAFYRDRCRAAGGCLAACPRGAIERTGERLRRERCDACGRCVEACAYGAWRLIGRRVAIDDLLADVLRDRQFFEASGGGVTLSGGEPTAQMAAAGGLARRCREAGVSVGLQTCGAFRWEAFAPHLPCFDFIHFDLKTVDAAEHRRLTGADNAAILTNARRLVAAGAPVCFRAPMVPGCTDTPANLERTAALLAELGVRELHLLPYHRLGESKLAPLGFPLTPLDEGMAQRAPAALAHAAELLRGLGLEICA